MALITLVKTFQGSTSYAVDHEGNYTLIEGAVNSLSDSLNNASVGTRDLRVDQLFDRNGIFGKASYKPVAATLTGPPYNLSIAAGAYYSGTEFRSAGTTTLVPLDAFSTSTLYVDVPTGGVPTVNSSAGADTVWSFSWNDTTHVVSAVTFYSATADILLDGDDYNGMLGSYLSVADRLAAIEALAGTISGYYAEDAGSHSGLNFGYFGGKVHNDNVVTTTADGTVLLTDATTNYVEVHPGTGVVSKNTTAFTAGRIPLFTVTTSGGTISVVTDQRTWARAGGGGGGGHTQNTDLGTDNTEFKLNRLHTGAPSSNCLFSVERGSSADASLRWNEATDKWEFTNDGSTFQEIGTGSADIGTQGLTSYVSKNDPTQLVERLAISSDGGYVQEDIGPTGDNIITDAPQGVEALVLRVQFWDSSPGAGVNVKFRKYGDAAAPTKSYTVWGGTNEQDDVATIVIPGDDGAGTIGYEYIVTASGAGTANVRIFLCGYFKKVTGTGSRRDTFQSAGNVATANTTTSFNLTAFINRGLVHTLKATETGATMTGLYDLEIYAKDTFAAADLLYKAADVDPAASSRVYTDRLPWFYEDLDATVELHIRIVNKDATNNGTFTFDLISEQFA